jgi:hypothetical protein
MPLWQHRPLSQLTLSLQPPAFFELQYAARFSGVLGWKTNWRCVYWQSCQQCSRKHYQASLHFHSSITLHTVPAYPCTTTNPGDQQTEGNTRLTWTFGAFHGQVILHGSPIVIMAVSAVHNIMEEGGGTHLVTSDVSWQHQLLVRVENLCLVGCLFLVTFYLTLATS